VQVAPPLSPPATTTGGPALPTPEVDRRFVGTWLERWEALGYHDRYRVEIGADGRPTVQVQGHSAGAPVTLAAWSFGVLTFVQRTSFDVRYRLTLSADGDRLEGTATTPDGAFEVVWERERPTDARVHEN
jgi:hypothetical protein